MTAGESAMQQQLVDALLDAVERAAADPEALRVVRAKVEWADLDPDGRSELEGRIATYLADCAQAAAFARHEREGSDAEDR